MHAHTYTLTGSWQSAGARHKPKEGSQGLLHLNNNNNNYAAERQRGLIEVYPVEYNRVEVWKPTLVYLCYSASHLEPRGDSHCTEAEGEGGWQTEAASAPAG